MEKLSRISTEIKNSTTEQEEGNKEVLDKVNHLKDVSIKNFDVVNKLQSIISGFAFSEIGLKEAAKIEMQKNGVNVVTE
jgi:hypothetical protein